MNNCIAEVVTNLIFDPLGSEKNLETTTLLTNSDKRGMLYKFSVQSVLKYCFIFFRELAMQDKKSIEGDYILQIILRPFQLFVLTLPKIK